MDPYLYPGTNVLKNLRHIPDAEILSKFEMDMATRRLAELAAKPTSGQFDRFHLQSIHRSIFQDVYAWAGEQRTVNIAKSGNLFALPQYLIPTLDQAFRELRNEDLFRGADPNRFANRAAHYLGELNAVHPFRDGNGRTQREFIRQLAVRNGYHLDWSRISRTQMIDASRESFRRSNQSLEQLLRSALVA